MIATLQAARIAGLVASEVESGRMTINAGCPECGQRFDISVELLDWIQGGCAACRAKEAEKKQ